MVNRAWIWRHGGNYLGIAKTWRTNFLIDPQAIDISTSQTENWNKLCENNYIRWTKISLMWLGIRAHNASKFEIAIPDFHIFWASPRSGTETGITWHRNNQWGIRRLRLPLDLSRAIPAIFTVRYRRKIRSTKLIPRQNWKLENLG